MQIQKHIRSLVLPVAIVLGALLHTYCGHLYFLVPYFVFTMLFLNYSAVDVRKMHFSWLHFWLLVIQIGCTLGFYLLMHLLHFNPLVTDGVLIGFLTPVAASVVVISCALGASRESVTTFTIIDNMMVALLAPVIFALIGEGNRMPFLLAFWKIFCRITPQIVLPFVTALLMQKFMPKANAAVCRIKGAGLYVWAVTLTIVLGKTFHDIITDPNPQWHLLTHMAILSLAMCALLFAVGKSVGKHYGEKMAGGQLLGQKNTSFGIWMAVEFLSPMAGIFSAFYSICQNLFNSWQMWRHDR